MKPILFNADMVRAILDNRKTVTRRVVKPQPSWRKLPVQQRGHTEYWANWDDERVYKAPYRPGDILYVRETWTRDGDVYRYKAGFYDQSRKWRPSIHMPRKAARIFLRVTGVSVERLQDITDDGIIRDFDFCADALKIMNAQQKDVACMALWDSTIKPAYRAIYGWDANPWVWVIEFERCEKPVEEGQT